MKKHWCVVFGALLFLPLTQAAPVVMDSTPISLGTVNGDVINDALTIERALSNPVLLLVTQDELDSPLRVLLFNQSKLIDNKKGEVSVKLVSPVKGGSVETLLTFEIWLDGQKADLFGKIRGDDVQVNVPVSFRVLEVRASKPLKIQLPKLYRGSFNFTFDIEAQP